LARTQALLIWLAQIVLPLTRLLPPRPLEPRRSLGAPLDDHLPANVANSKGPLHEPAITGRLLRGDRQRYGDETSTQAWTKRKPARCLRQQPQPRTSAAAKQFDASDAAILVLVELD
jgi:hypothetical protein